MTTANRPVLSAIAEGDRPHQISYNVCQAAMAVGLGESTLRRLVREGRLAARYYGTTVLIDAEDLARFYRSLPSERGTA